MNLRLLDAMFLVIGAAVIFNGFLGRDLRNNVEMPMTEDEIADKTPPSRPARIIYILFGGGLFAYGFSELFIRRLH